MTTKRTKKTSPSTKINSVSEFTKLICDKRDEWTNSDGDFQPWFRGQANATWKLEPNIYRHGLLENEDDLRDDFERCAQQYMTEATPRDYWGWYFLMQHYGAPTRLLDWTDGAFIALFFALHAACPKDGPVPDAAVWMLDPWWLNKRSLGDNSILNTDFDAAKLYLRKPYDSVKSKRPNYPAAIDPPFIARRVAVQRGHFTIFGKDKSALEKLGTEAGARLVKYELAGEKLDEMRHDLSTLGITDTSIYPDLSGLSKELIRYWKRV